MVKWLISAFVVLIAQNLAINSNLEEMSGKIKGLRAKVLESREISSGDWKQGKFRTFWMTWARRRSSIWSRFIPSIIAKRGSGRTRRKENEGEKEWKKILGKPLFGHLLAFKRISFALALRWLKVFRFSSLDKRQSSKDGAPLPWLLVFATRLIDFISII